MAIFRQLQIVLEEFRRLPTISEDCRRSSKTNEEVRPLPKTSEEPSKDLTVISSETVNIKKLANLIANTKHYGQITLNTNSHSDPRLHVCTVKVVPLEQNTQTYEVSSGLLKIRTMPRERSLSLFSLFYHITPLGGGRGVLPYMGYIGMCHCEGYGFQAIYSGTVFINHRVWV